jgi:transposase
VKYVGLDWAYRTAQWCALAPAGEIAGEGRIASDRDGLARLVLELGDEGTACLEMMSGALWVRDQLVACGWHVDVADARKVKTVAPLAAIPDVAELLALTIAVEIGEISRFASPEKLVSYGRLAPRVHQSGDGRARSGPLSKSGSRLLAWAAVEAAQQAWRESNPWHELYLEVGRRSRHTNTAKAAVARKILIAAWHMLSRNQPFKPGPRRTSVPASSRMALAA